MTLVSGLPPNPGQAPAPLPTVEDLLDALPDATAVLDRDGVIVATNRAWQMFAQDNGGSGQSTGAGVSYLDVCTRAAAAGCADADQVLAALREVLLGGTVEAVLEYSCPSPNTGRWFALRITPVAGATGGALVSHVNITRQKMAERDLEQQASQDPLTGLANRTRFDRRLTAALTPRRGRAPRQDVGVVYLDLDGFKPVNDRFGHAAGDEVLQNVASRLQDAVRANDTVARLGGDEFAVVCPRIDAARLAALVARLTRLLAEPHLVHGAPIVVPASLGSCLAGAGDEPAEVLHRADLSMYEAKRRRQPQA